jgi:hypothetical protein
MGKYDSGGTTKMRVPMKPAGNVKSGGYSMVNDGKSFAACNGTFDKPPLPAGNHRKTLTPGKVRGHHRGG